MAVVVGYDHAVDRVVMLSAVNGRAVAQLAVLSPTDARKLATNLILAAEAGKGAAVIAVTAEAGDHTQLSIFEEDADHGHRPVV